MPTTTPTFTLGSMMMTAGIAHASQGTDFPVAIAAGLLAHLDGDWGDVDDKDRAANDRALVDGGRLVSSYPVPDGMLENPPDDHFLVITEADRSATTVLWPSEY